MQRLYVITGIDPVLNKTVQARVPARSAADAVQLAAECGVYCAQVAPCDEPVGGAVAHGRADGAHRHARSRSGHRTGST